MTAKEAAYSLWELIEKYYNGQFAVGVGKEKNKEILIIYSENKINLSEYSKFLRKYNGYKVITKIIGRVKQL